MEYIKDEHTTNALESILVVICAESEKKIAKECESSGHSPIQNLALQLILKDEHYYRVKLLDLLNRGMINRFDKCLETVNILLNKESTKNFFGVNDLHVLLDICLG
jgi:hypothetical protein